jgi:hypothetical protein
MKDQRLHAFRTAVDALNESLEALVRVSRWTEEEAPPESLSTPVSKLMERLGTASRLVSKPFHGTAADTVKVTAMCTALKRLDAAYLVYHRRIAASPAEKLDAASALELEISEAMGTAISLA